MNAPGNNEVFIIGGGEIYAHFWAHTERVYITTVDLLAPDTDTFFPSYIPDVWHNLVETRAPANAEKGYPAYTFRIYDRKKWRPYAWSSPKTRW